MWKAIERLKQGESINVQDLETNLYWEFGKFTSQDGESLESYYSRFVTLVKQSQELKTVSYHKLYDIMKQHQNEVNEIRAERIARVANPLVLIAQQQPVYHPQNHPTQYTQNSSTRSQQAVTRNKGKEIANSPQPIYDQEPYMVAEDDEMSKDKEIDKLMALISLSFKKSTNLPTTTFELHQTPVEQIRIILQGLTEALEQADWRDDTDDELEDQELEAHYIEHPEQSESIHVTYPIEQDEHNVIIDSFDMSYDTEQIDQNDDDADLVNESPESNEVIRLEKESRSKLSDLIRTFDYDKLNNLYDLFVSQREKSSEQRYFSERSRLSRTPVNNGNSKETFSKQTNLIEKRIDESIPWDQKCKSSIELFKIKSSVDTIFDGVERSTRTGGSGK
nr:hypothetical protein [Tanacetum cinerariifolium]